MTTKEKIKGTFASQSDLEDRVEEMHQYLVSLSQWLTQDYASRSGNTGGSGQPPKYP